MKTPESLVAIVVISIAAASCSTTTVSDATKTEQMNSRPRAAKTVEKTSADYIQEIRKRHPAEQPVEIVFYTKFLELKAEYARSQRKLFKDPRWPLYLEERAMDAVKRDAAREAAIAGIADAGIRSPGRPPMRRGPSALDTAASLNAAGGLSSSSSLNGGRLRK